MFLDPTQHLDRYAARRYCPAVAVTGELFERGVPAMLDLIVIRTAANRAFPGTRTPMTGSH